MVAPLVGAWIEILRKPQLNIARVSLPSWERGLKLLNFSLPLNCMTSLPSWERGLKLPYVLGLLTDEGRSPRGSVD